jgi:hypothetical protein
MSCNLSFIFDRPIIWKTVIYIVQSDNSTCCILDIDVYRFRRLIVDWSVENVNHYITPRGRSLDINVSSTKTKKKNI